MDPNAALRLVMDTLDDMHSDHSDSAKNAAKDALFDLRQWIVKGGARPTPSSDEWIGLLALIRERI